MSVDVRSVLDLSDTHLSRVPFGRNRALRAAGLVLFGLAAAAALPKTASAQPYPCFGYGACSCCSGSSCCDYQCSAAVVGCPGGGQCWDTCAGGTLYRCCDWYSPEPAQYCICSAVIGSC